MKLPLTLLHLAAGAVALPAVSRMSWAQTDPSRPVQRTVFFSPATRLDQKPSPRLGATLVRV
jgi:hypothetical protein